MENLTNIDIEKFHLPRWDELPSIDLYLDQVVTLINNCLAPYIFYSENQDACILTKTMINNYVKHKIIEPPVKKQYTRLQVAKIFSICVLKQVYSMHDIKNLLSIALNGSTAQNSYDKFCNLFEKALLCTYKKIDFIDKNRGNDNVYLLKSVLLSCSYKIYVQNICARKIQKSNTNTAL